MSGTVANERLCLSIPSFEDRIINALRHEFEDQFREITARHIEEARDKLVAELKKEAELIITKFALQISRGFSIDTFKDAVRLEVYFPLSDKDKKGL